MKLTIENPGKSSAAEARKLAIMMLRRGYVNIEPTAAEPAMACQMARGGPEKKNNSESIPAALKRKHAQRAGGGKCPA